jgi:type I restriction enzyme M protein
MTGLEQRAELQRQIWKIANDLRGAVDGWDFKQYVLGALFYRFLSENFQNYAEKGDTSVNYATYKDDALPESFKHEAIKTKGYFIYPSQLFANVVKNAFNNDNLNTDLKNIFTAIQSSANGYPSEQDIKGLFDDFDTTSNRLGSTVKERNTRLTAILKGVEGLQFGNFEENKIDLFGDAYEFLISNYAANAGKSGGEYFTPQNVSKLIAKLAMHGNTNVDKIYDPACGSGSLLLQAKKQHQAHDYTQFFGQDNNPTTYNLARMNMFLHNIDYNKFEINLGDTLINPAFKGKKFDVIVSNPPYSTKWIGDDNPTLINDDRFAPASTLAPKSKADFAFIMHSLNYLHPMGRGAIVCFPGIFYRGGAEQKIRQYLVEQNYIEAIISLAPNLFFGTSIAVTILVLAKNKQTTDILFINASGEDFFRKETNNNVMHDEHIEKIVEIFAKKQDIPHISRSVRQEEMKQNDYNLSVSSYLEAKDTREKVDIQQLNEELKTTVAKISTLRAEIEKIVNQI